MQNIHRRSHAWNITHAESAEQRSYNLPLLSADSALEEGLTLAPFVHTFTFHWHDQNAQTHSIGMLCMNIHISLARHDIYIHIPLACYNIFLHIPVHAKDFLVCRTRFFGRGLLIPPGHASRPDGALQRATMDTLLFCRHALAPCPCTYLCNARCSRICRRSAVVERLLHKVLTSQCRPASEAYKTWNCSISWCPYIFDSPSPPVF